MLNKNQFREGRGGGDFFFQQRKAAETQKNFTPG